MRKFSIILALAAVVIPGRLPAQTIEPPQGSVLVKQVQGGGAQIYACRASVDGSYAWSLVRPNAILVNDDGSEFGTNTAGPRWTASDGSSIVADGAHPLAQVSRPNAVPELVLRVTSQSGAGVLSKTRYVTRTDTEGGIAPQTGCDAKHASATIARHYSAVYSFYQ